MNLSDLAGFALIAFLGALLAATNWLRLLWGQRVTTILLHTGITHLPVLWVLSLLSSFYFPQLLEWDAAIFAACYISYCAYLAYIRVDYLARPPFSTQALSATPGIYWLEFCHCLVRRAIMPPLEKIAFGPSARR